MRIVDADGLWRLAAGIAMQVSDDGVCAVAGREVKEAREVLGV